MAAIRRYSIVGVAALIVIAALAGWLFCIYILPWILCPPFGSGPYIDFPKKLRAVRGESVVIIVTAESDCWWPHQPIARQVTLGDMVYQATLSNGQKLNGKIKTVLSKETPRFATFVATLDTVPRTCVALEFEIPYSYTNAAPSQHYDIVAAVSDR